MLGDGENSGTSMLGCAGDKIGEGGSEAYIIGLGSRSIENLPSGDASLSSECERTACPSSSPELSEKARGV